MECPKKVNLPHKCFKMKKTLFIGLFLTTFFGYSQNAEIKIAENIQKMEKALIEKDSLVLQTLLHDDLSFGHSNAYIETKQDILNDLKTKQITYTFFSKKSDINFTFLSDNTIVTRRKINATGTFQRHDFNLDMNILEVWIFDQAHWKLLSRQGVKLAK